MSAEVSLQSKARALAQAEAFAALARAFAYPDDPREVSERLRIAAEALRQQAPSDAERLQRLAQRPASVFDYAPIMKGTVPLSLGAFQVGAAADVAGFCRAFGVQTKAGEGPDTLPAVLELLALLLLKEAMAPDTERRRLTQRAYAELLRVHLARFLPRLRERMQAVGAARFYQEAAELLQRWTDRELRRLGVQEPQPQEGAEGASAQSGEA